MRYCEVDVVDVKVLHDYVLLLKFDNGVEGEVDISTVVEFKGVFQPLQDVNFFNDVVVDGDLGTICWKNGADLSPTRLYNSIKKSVD